MPIHDWTRVNAWIFHHFHLAWMDDVAGRLNEGILPSDYYALAEQIAGRLGPDVLTLQRQNRDVPIRDPRGCVAVESAPPKVRYRVQAEPGQYATKARTVVIRHSSRHQIIAMIEIVSPGNKSNRHAIRAFVQKALDALQAGIHLLIIDLFPHGRRDPRGIHALIWSELVQKPSRLPDDKPLALMAYVGGPSPVAYVEPIAVSEPLPEMPLFLTPDDYVSVPLDSTYQSAWARVPEFWREALQGSDPN